MGLPSATQLQWHAQHRLFQEWSERSFLEVTAVNWGQWHGPYALPPERLVLCASGKAFVWLQGGKNESAFVALSWHCFFEASVAGAFKQRTFFLTDAAPHPQPSCKMNFEVCSQCYTLLQFSDSIREWCRMR